MTKTQKILAWVYVVISAAAIALQYIIQNAPVN